MQLGIKAAIFHWNGATVCPSGMADKALIPLVNKEVTYKVFIFLKSQQV